MKKVLGLAALMVFAAGCGSPVTTSPEPTPELLSVALTHNLPADIPARAHVCITSDLTFIPDFSYHQPSSVGDPFDLYLYWGHPQQAPFLTEENYSAVKIGQQDLQVVVHQGNKLAALSQDQLRSILSGRIEDWTELPSSRISGKIQLYLPPTGDSLRYLISLTLLGGERVTPSAVISSDYDSTLDFVRSDPRGISLIAGNSSPPGVNSINLEGQEFTSYPVLAIYPNHKSADLRPVLACLLDEGDP